MRIEPAAEPGFQNADARSGSPDAPATTNRDMTDAESGGKKKGAPLDYLLQFESLRADRVAKLREIFDFVTQGSGVIKVRGHRGHLMQF